MSLAKRLFILFVALAVVLGIGLLFTYDVIKIQWVSMMGIQPSYRPMKDPLPLPSGSVPVQGVAYVPESGDPGNPVVADPASVQRGAQLFEINCALCHGTTGHGDGSIAKFMLTKPADLSSSNVKGLSDGSLFLVITRGIPGYMPALRENLSVGDRWDVINYLRTIQK